MVGVLIEGIDVENLDKIIVNNPVQTFFGIAVNIAFQIDLL